MPLYEYACPRCEAVFEELVPASKADEGPACPSCGEKKTTRKVSTFAGRMGTSKSAEMPSCPTGSCCFGGACGN